MLDGRVEYVGDYIRLVLVSFDLQYCAASLMGYRDVGFEHCNRLDGHDF